MSKRTIEEGARYGMLTVIDGYPDASRNALVLCDCGKTKMVSRQRLTLAQTRSCSNHFRVKHGHTAKRSSRKVSRAYVSWGGMKQRCNNPNAAEFKNYGARGITYCEQWESFENFYRDMGDPPVGHSLERIDNSNGYSRENCKWGTKREQSENRRCVTKITIGEKSQSASWWARELGIRRGVIYKRIKLGWSQEAAVLTPLAERYRK